MLKKNVVDLLERLEREAFLDERISFEKSWDMKLSDEERAFHRGRCDSYHTISQNINKYIDRLKWDAH